MTPPGGRSLLLRKTAFIKLLCRLCDPTEGEILLNGIDIRKYRCSPEPTKK